MLTVQAIAALADSGEMHWEGDFRGDGLLLRLGTPLQPFAAAPAEVDLADQASIDALYRSPIHDWQTFVLEPARLVLCQASEPLRLGPGLCGIIGTLSHLARAGLMTHLSSPLVLPGWDGHVTLELFNAGPSPLRLRCGMPAARLVISPMVGPARDAAPAHPFYGHSALLGSRYADEFGPVAR
ncbi:MAG: dCTP deaminase [Egibacteraceae bacterium]